MTRTARYNAETNTFRELPGMEKPENPAEILGKGADIYFFHASQRLREYNDHVASLREIPCHYSCKGVFLHDCDYEEGKHYKLQDDPCPYFEDIDDPVEYTTYAYPIVSPKSEDELWNEVVAKVATHDIVRQVKPADNVQKLVDWKGKVIAELKTKYTITPR